MPRFWSRSKLVQSSVMQVANTGLNKLFIIMEQQQEEILCFPLFKSERDKVLNV